MVDVDERKEIEAHQKRIDDYEKEKQEMKIK